MRKLLTVLFVLFASASFFAQDVIIDLDENGDVILFNVRENKKPLIELTYSFMQLDHEDFVNPSAIKQDGDFQLRLGYTATRDTKIRKIYEEYVFFGYSSPSMNLGGENTGTHSFEIWKGGSVSRIGYAISLSKSVDFIPYYAGGIFLYSMSHNYEGAVLAYYHGEPNNTIIGRTADEKIHFGNTLESGVRLKFNDKLSVFGGYTGYVYYPRFMTWKFLGSLITYQIGLTLLDNFNRRIIRNSSVAGVIIDVILKSAYNYMFYYFQKGDMNWPVSTETPFTQEGFTAGFSINF